MITYEWLYILAGIFFAIWAVLSALDRSNGKRWGNAAFWGLLAVSFLFGSHFTPLLNGVLVLALVAIAGVGGLGRSDPPTTTLEERFKLAELKGNRLFVPALIVPFVAVAGTLAYNWTPLSGTGLFEPRRETLLLFAIGVLVGVLLSGIFFVQKVMHMFEVERTRTVTEEGETATYTAHGEIFFGSVARFEAALGPESLQPDPADHVIIDVTRAHFWDISAIGALDKVVERMRMHGRSVQVVGLNEASADLVDRHGATDRTGVEIGLAPHP